MPSTKSLVLALALTAPAAALVPPTTQRVPATIRHADDAARAARREALMQASERAAARIEAGAVLDLVDGVGMYEEFRYPLHDVKARLVVENELIRILRLEGSGPGSGPLSRHTLAKTRPRCFLNSRPRTEI